MATIAAVCPHCESTYQVDAALAGRRMRCPNSICRAIFEVKPPGASVPPTEERPDQRDTEAQGKGGGARSASEGDPAPRAETPRPAASITPPRPKQQSGNVSDLIPVLPTEPLVPVNEPPVEKEKPSRPAPPPSKPKTPAPALVPTWQGAPPPVRGQRVEAPTVSAPATTDDAFPEFSELDGDATADTPTPETTAAVADPAPSSEQTTPVSLFPDPEPAHKGRRRNLVVMLLLALVLAGLGVGALYLIQRRQAGNEAERYQAAVDAYQKKDYAQAATLLQALSRDFPDSAKRNEYRFLTELSDLRSAVHRPSSDPSEVVRANERVFTFLSRYENDALLKDRHGDLWQVLEHVAKDLITHADKSTNDGLLALARRTWKEAGKFTPPREVNPKEAQTFLTREFTRVEQAIAQKTYRDESLAELAAFLERPSGPAVEEALTLVQSRKLDEDEEAKKLIEALKTAHRESITYQSVDKTPVAKPPQPDAAQYVVLSPVSVRPEQPGPEKRPSLLCLVRGILYALDPKDGAIRWARRLGADTRHPPLTIAAAPPQPEMLIATATDDPAILALEAASGRELWRHPLTNPCLTAPIRVEGKLLIPTLSGRVDEIDLATGKLHGFYDLGQPLTVGGVHQPGTSLVYLPAAQTCLYVLDVAKRKCEQVVYLRHGPQSLSCAPVFLDQGGTGEGKGASLLLSVATEERAELRRYALPFENADPQPSEKVSLPGVPSFPPMRVGDRLGIAGDNGSFTLLGLRPHGDILLYPLVPQDAGGGEMHTRSLIAWADPQTWLVLGNGRLHRYSVGLTAKEGLRMAKDWSSLRLGLPLHMAEKVEAGDDPCLFLTTQLPNEPTSLATLVDLGTGKIRWQRELGQVAQGPIRLAGKDLLLHGPRGLYRLTLPAKENAWSEAVVEPLKTPFANQPLELLTQGSDPTGFVWSPVDPLHLHRIENGKAGTRSWKLPHPPRGTWTAHGKTFVIPLANGDLVALEEIESGVGKTHRLDAWRAAGVEEQLPGHVVSLSDTALAVTDGNLVLRVLHWSQPGKDPTTGPKHTFSQRILAAPAKVKLKDGKIALAVVDAGNQLTLLDGESLRPLRSWMLPGKLTTGPIVRGSGLLCVVGKNRLVYIDPDQTVVAGEHTALAQIVGLPEVFDNHLLVADLAGQITWIELTTDLPVRRTHVIPAAVVPVATPTQVDGRVLVPLSDGTVMLIEGRKE